MNTHGFDLRRAIAPLIVLAVGSTLAAITATTRFEGLSRVLMLITAAATITFAVLAVRTGDLATILTAGRDERQSLIVLKAAAIAGIAMILICLALACRHLLQREGHSPEPYLALCATFSIIFLGSVIAVQRHS
jgi:RsiW-degrading membrane proteinase PrsW (M82 family)